MFTLLLFVTTCLGAGAWFDLHVVGGSPLDQPLLGAELPVLAVVHQAVAVLLLLLGLPQVDEGQHQREEDDDQGPEQQRHHHPLRVGLVAQGVALPAPGLSLVLDTAPAPLEAGAKCAVTRAR